jgi:arylsulfatase
MPVRRHALSAAAAAAAAAAVLGLVLAAGGCSPKAAAHPTLPDNVVIVVIDTLRQDHLATYGYARNPAPFLGELARDGAVFDGLSPSSWTKPATASLLTGLYPVRHQAVDRWDRLSPAAIPLAERLRRRGYHTLGASTNEWVSPVFGFDRGFDRFVMDRNFPGPKLVRELLPALDRLEPPFFLYVHLVDPHSPYRPAAGWDGRPLSAALQAAGPVTVEEIDTTQRYPRPAAFLSRATDLYDGGIRAADDALRALVERLRRRGLMRSTILVVTADHGEALGEHDHMGHGQTLYQELLRIPLVIDAPHRFRGGRRPGRASLLDVAPTLAELLGWPREPGDPGFDGVSLVPLLAGTRPAAASRPFLEHLDFTDGAALALLAGDRKLILEKGRNQLFDLAKDPGERHDRLAAPTPADAAVFARLSAELGAMYNAAARAGLPRGGASQDAALQRRLAALGYVGGGQEVRARTIPVRLDLPADPRPGWKAFGSPMGCLRLTGSSDRGLLEGWYDQELGGRWTGRRAALLLQAAAAGAPADLVLEGNNLRPGAVPLSVSVGHHPVLSATVPRGPFRLSAPVPGNLLAEPAEVELETASAFVPAGVSADKGAGDRRALGIFLSSVCFQSPAPPLRPRGKPSAG